MKEKDRDNPGIEEIINEKDSNIQKEKYNEYVKNMTPKNNGFLNCVKAFAVGGSICLLGEIFSEIYKSMGNDDKLAGLYSTMTLIGLSIILTGFNIYQKLGQFAGAGSIVPITGFANSLTSAALESKSEGVVLGIATNLFKLAGAVIVFAVVSAYVFGILRYLLIEFNVLG